MIVPLPLVSYGGVEPRHDSARPLMVLIKPLKSLVVVTSNSAGCSAARRRSRVRREAVACPAASDCRVRRRRCTIVLRKLLGSRPLEAALDGVRPPGDCSAAADALVSRWSIRSCPKPPTLLVGQTCGRRCPGR